MTEPAPLPAAPSMSSPNSEPGFKDKFMEGYWGKLGWGFLSGLLAMIIVGIIIGLVLFITGPAIGGIVALAATLFLSLPLAFTFYEKWRECECGPKSA